MPQIKLVHVQDTKNTGLQIIDLRVIVCFPTVTIQNCFMKRFSRGARKLAQTPGYQKKDLGQCIWLTILIATNGTNYLLIALCSFHNIIEIIIPG